MKVKVYNVRVVVFDFNDDVRSDEDKIKEEVKFDGFEIVACETLTEDEARSKNFCE